MVQLEFPYDQQAQAKENVYLRVGPSRTTSFIDSFNAIKSKPGRSYAESDYYLYVERVGSVVHHWLLCSRELYSRELNQVTLALANYLRSEDNLDGVTMDEFPDAQSAIRWLNIMAAEHGLNCSTSHRGDEITLDGKTWNTVVHYVSVGLDDFQEANRCIKWHPCRLVRS
jgi:hypothetical protein